MEPETDLFMRNYQEAVNYLENRFDSRRQHPSQVKAAIRRCFETPMFLRATPDIKVQADTLRVLMDMSSVRGQGHLKRNFTLYVIMDYVREIVRFRRGNESVIESGESMFGPVMLDRARKFPKEISRLIRDDPEVLKCKVYSEVLDRIRRVSEQLEESIRSLLDPKYAQERAKDNLERIREELMIKTWHPSRVRWWMDHEDQKELLPNL